MVRTISQNLLGSGGTFFVVVTNLSGKLMRAANSTRESWAYLQAPGIPRVGSLPGVRGSLERTPLQYGSVLW